MILFRQRAQRLAEKPIALHTERPLLARGTEKKAGHFEKIANINQPEQLISCLVDLVDAKIELNASCAVLNIHKGDFAEDTLQANTPYQGVGPFRALPCIKMLQHQINGMGALHRRWIRINRLAL